MGRQSAAKNHLLLIAAGKGLHRLARVRRAYAQLRDGLIRQTVDPLRRQDALEPGELAERREGNIAAHGERHHQPFPFAVFRDEGDAGSDRIARRANPGNPRADANPAGTRRQGTVDGLEHLRPAGANETAEADHLPGPHLEGDILKGARCCEPINLEQHLAERRVPLGETAPRSGD